MPHIDSLGNDEIRDIFLSPEARARALSIRLQDIRIRALRREVKQEMLNLNETSRLKNAKQVLFDFAEPGEDWGSTT